MLIHNDPLGTFLSLAASPLRRASTPWRSAVITAVVKAASLSSQILLQATNRRGRPPLLVLLASLTRSLGSLFHLLLHSIPLKSSFVLNQVGSHFSVEHFLPIAIYQSDLGRLEEFLEELLGIVLIVKFQKNLVLVLLGKEPDVDVFDPFVPYCLGKYLCDGVYYYLLSKFISLQSLDVHLENVWWFFLGDNPQEKGNVSIVVLSIERMRVSSNTIITASTLMRALLLNLEHLWLLPRKLDSLCLLLVTNPVLISRRQIHWGFGDQRLRRFVCPLRVFLPLYLVTLEILR